MLTHLFWSGSGSPPSRITFELARRSSRRLAGSSGERTTDILVRQIISPLSSLVVGGGDGGGVSSTLANWRVSLDGSMLLSRPSLGIPAPTSASTRASAESTPSVPSLAIPTGAASPALSAATPSSGRFMWLWSVILANISARLVHVTHGTVRMRRRGNSSIRPAGPPSISIYRARPGARRWPVDDVGPSVQTSRPWRW